MPKPVTRSLSVYANDPDQLKDEPPELVGAVQQAVSRSVRPFRECISRNQTNWTVIAAAGAGWAARVFPELPPEKQVARLWDAIAALCRLDQPGSDCGVGAASGGARAHGAIT